MKKLMIGTLAVLNTALMLLSCGSQGTSTGSANFEAAATNPTLEITLNGYSKADADTMVKIARDTDSVGYVPPNTQVWFSKQIVDSVYSLLRTDSAGKHKPDGVRIYFSDTSTSRLKPIKYGIVVVSTDSTGVDISDPHNKIIIHTDYYTHASNAGLFKMGNINGEITHDDDATNGDSLYTACGCPVNDTCLASSDHYITKATAIEMAKAFKGMPLKARGEWFSIKMLSTLVKEMDDKQESGIRIYFSRGTAHTVKTEDIGKARFVIVSTKAENKGNRCDYFGCSRTLARSARAQPNPNGGSTNNGELCPNHCQGATLPTP